MPALKYTETRVQFPAPPLQGHLRFVASGLLIVIFQPTEHGERQVHHAILVSLEVEQGEGSAAEPPLRQDQFFGRSNGLFSPVPTAVVGRVSTFRSQLFHMPVSS